jgi:hypothetical protein
MSMVSQLGRSNLRRVWLIQYQGPSVAHTLSWSSNAEANTNSFSIPDSAIFRILPAVGGKLFLDRGRAEL